MKLTKLKKILFSALAIVLIAALALFASGCESKNATENVSSAESASERIVLGDGETAFLFTVTEKDGSRTYFEIHTDQTNVGEALLDLEIIDGVAAEYGLYVKKVNGQVYDYDSDGYYWSFYVDGKYATKGVEQTEIKSGESYEFKAEKA